MDGNKLNLKLFGAVERGSVEETRQLLEQGADLECRDPFGNTPLISAAWIGSVDLVKYLISLGANVSATDREGKTALDLISTIGHNKYGHDAVIAVLREHMAKPKVWP